MTNDRWWESRLNVCRSNATRLYDATKMYCAVCIKHNLGYRHYRQIKQSSLSIVVTLYSFKLKKVGQGGKNSQRVLLAWSFVNYLISKYLNFPLPSIFIRSKIDIKNKANLRRKIDCVCSIKMMYVWCPIALALLFVDYLNLFFVRLREIYRRLLTSIYWCRRWCFRRTRDPARKRTGKWTLLQGPLSMKDYRAAAIPYETNEPYASCRPLGHSMSPPEPFRCYYFLSSFLSAPFEKWTFLISLFNGKNYCSICGGLLRQNEGMFVQGVLRIACEFFQVFANFLVMWFF